MKWCALLRLFGITLRYIGHYHSRRLPISACQDEVHNVSEPRKVLQARADGLGESTVSFEKFC